MLKCPVCGQEHIENKVEFCSNCSYLLTPCPPNLLQNYEIQEREKKRLQSAQEAWKKICYSYSQFKQNLEAANAENSLLKQQLETATDLKQQLETATEENLLLKQQLQAANENNQTSLNNSSVAQSLSKISTNVECLPDMLTILQQINEKLPSQSLSKILLTETESKNQANEPDLSNESDNLNDNNEVFNDEVFNF